jgi:hypothetical protein
MKLILIGISILLMVIIYKLCEISNQLFSYYVSIKDYLYSIRKAIKEREHE